MKFFRKHEVNWMGDVLVDAISFCAKMGHYPSALYE